MTNGLSAMRCGSDTWPGPPRSLLPGGDAEGDQPGTDLADDILRLLPGGLERSSALDSEAQDLAFCTINKVPAIGVVIARP